jgi:hypothetical protein
MIVTGSRRPLRKNPDRGGIAAHIGKGKETPNFVACSPPHIRDHPLRSPTDERSR